MVTTELIDQIVETIARQFQPRRIVLFGSRARDQARPDSDIDLFVEMETTLSPPERAIAINAAFGLRPWSMDVVVYTPGEVERLRTMNGTLLSIIEREGQLLYESPTQQLRELARQGRERSAQHRE